MAQRIQSISPFNTLLKLRGFNVFQIEKDDNAVRVYSRKDFYKLCLTTGVSKIHYADRSYKHEGTVLFCGNPHIPYAWETISTEYKGYTCLFSEDFLKLGDRSASILQSPLFRLNGTPILQVTEEERESLNSIFTKMITEQDNDYKYKDDVIRNYIHLLIHEAIRLDPAEYYERKKDAASRLTSVFLELLERQFPIESPEKPLLLNSATGYAAELSVHVNYLNRMVKQVTGKTTSEHISQRVLREATALLQNTDWNIGEIAFALGFDYPTYFSNFIKKLTGKTPKTLRAHKV